MFRSLAILCVLVGAVSAEVRYTIHPTDGEFTKTSNPCGAQTKDELFDRVLKFVPVLVLREVSAPDGKGGMVLNIAGDDHPADETSNNEGRWFYNGKQQLKTQKVLLGPVRSNKRVISISVIRRMDELECSERWLGTVEVSNGN